MKRLLLTLVFASVALAGCGGGDDDALSASEFKQQANAICKAGSKKLDTAAEKAFGGLGENEAPSDEAMKSFLEDDFKPNIKSQISDLRDLDGPGDVEADLDGILDDAEKILDKVTIDVFKQDEDPFADVNDRFTTLGLTECSDSE
jgi:hypothetical protein